MKNYYYILGIKETATREEIKVAYRKLSKKFHPDINQEDKFFEERFKDIQEAYETLSNDLKRKSYDEMLREFLHPGEKSEERSQKKESTGVDYGIEILRTARKSTKQKKQETDDFFDEIYKVVSPIFMFLFFLCGIFAVYDQVTKWFFTK